MLFSHCPSAAARASRIGALLVLLALLALAGCDHPAPVTDSDIRFRMTANARSAQLDEISGLQASHRHPGLLWVHNDDGEARVHALGVDGSDLGHFDITDAVNVDWEDMTRVPGTERDLLVLADIGDTGARRSNVWLYLVPDPDPGENGRFSGTQSAVNWISLTYPDGPRDAESITWDPVRNRLLILTRQRRRVEVEERENS